MTNIQVPAPIEEKIYWQYPGFEALQAEMLRMASTGQVGNESEWSNFCFLLHDYGKQCANIGYNLVFIPVEERLPENDKWVIVAGRFHDGIFSLAQTHYYHKGEWYNNDSGQPEKDIEITHWMPLPQPPQQ